MPDFALEHEIEAHVDHRGDAKKIRQWTLRNLTKASLDFRRWQLWFDLPCDDVRIAMARDSLGRELAWHTDARPNGHLRVFCDFDRVIEVGETYRIYMEYEQGAYFRCFPSGSFTLSEPFSREPLGGSYRQQEPERWTYSLTIADPRRHFGPFTDPTRVLAVETIPEGRPISDGSLTSFRWDFGLRSDDIYFVNVQFRLRRRWPVLISTGGLFTAAAGAALWEFVRGLLGL